MASVWSFSPEDTQLYSRMFAAADSAGRGRVNFAQSQLQRSGLPVGILQQIWQLADTDSDAELTRPEYFAACHMIMRNLKLKTPLPAALPVELSSTAAGASGAPLPTAPGGDAMSSIFGAPQAAVAQPMSFGPSEAEKAARVAVDKAAAEQAAKVAQAQAAARAAEQAAEAEAARLAAERAAAERAAAAKAAAERAAAERAAVAAAEQAAAQKAAASLAQLPADPFGRPAEPFGGGAAYSMDSPQPNTHSHFGPNALGVPGATAQGGALSAGSYAPASAPAALGGGGGSLPRHSLLAALARAWQGAAPGPSGSSPVSSPVSSLADWAAGPDLDSAAVARLGRAAAELLGHGSGPSVQAGGRPQAGSGMTDTAQGGGGMGGPNAGGGFRTHAGTGHAPPVAAQAPPHDSFSSLSGSMGAALPAASPWAQPYGSGMSDGMDSGMGGGMGGGMGVDVGGGGMVGGGASQQDPFSGLGMGLGGSSDTYAMGNGHQDAQGMDGGMGGGVGPGDAHSAPSPMINPSAFSMAAPTFGAPAAAPAASTGALGTDHFGGGMVDFGGGAPSPAALGPGVASGGNGPPSGEAAFGPAAADFGGGYAQQQPSSSQQPPAADGFGYSQPQPAAQAAAGFSGSSGFDGGDYGGGDYGGSGYGGGGFSGEPSCCTGGGAAFGGGASAAGPSDCGAGYRAPAPAYGATAFGGGGGDGFSGSLAGDDGFGYLAGGGLPPSSQFGTSPLESQFGTSQQQQQQGAAFGGATSASDFGAMGFGGAPTSQANDGFGFGPPSQGFGSPAPAAPVDAGGFGAGFDASFGVAAAQPPAADFGSLSSSFGQSPPPAATSHGGGGSPGFVSTFDDDFSGIPPPAPAPAPAPAPPPPPRRPRAPVESGIAPMTSSELAQYRLLFDSVGGGAPVTRAQADSVFARAQLPSDEVDLIWVINDLDMDGNLLADEFAVALHIAAARYKGARLPEERPEGLLPAAEARASGSYSSRGGGYDHGGGGYDHGGGAGGNEAGHGGGGGGGGAGESASAKSRWRMGGSAAKISMGRRDGASAPAPAQDYGGGYGGGGGGRGGGGGGASRFGLLLHNKKPRWCTLSGGCFSVYKAQHDKAPQTQLSLRTDVQRVWQSNMATFSLVLEPNRAGAKPRKGPAAPPEKLEFTADSPMELTAWVQALQQAIATSKS